MTQLPSLSLTSPQEVATGPDDVVFTAAFCGESPVTEGLPEAVRRTVERLAGRSGWQGREGQRFAAEAGEGGVQVELHGLGERDDGGPRKLDEWLRDALERATKNGAATVSLVLPDHPSLHDAGAAAWLGRALVRAAYRFDRFQARRGDGYRVAAVHVVAPAGTPLGAGGERAWAVAAGVTLCRDLGNAPGNEATPQWMAEQAAALAGEHGMAIEVLERPELEARGMGGILAVGAGSHHEPRLVRLEWGGRGPRVALVGKGVTFDTGGISIKPAKDMDEMKYDKCGACTVLGVARAVAELDLPLRLAVYVPLAENMPGGRSYRPGDIVRCYDGKTVEILNTDAEGRMILADALAWAAEEEPDVLLEYSTLTGASVIALGQDAASLYSPDEELAGGLLDAAGRTGERLWRMPLWPEFVERMKGNHADLKNSGPRWGGANTAAAFLAQFVAPLTRWAHLDIAGAAYVGRDADDEPGATGYGVAFTVDWLCRLAV
jgi:leucyl aminopeptidase